MNRFCRKRVIKKI